MKPMLKSAVLVLALLTGIVISPRLWSGIQNYSIDGVAGVIGTVLAPEDTVYASKYTAAGWKRVRVGMSRNDVDAILGPPQLTYPVEKEQDGPDSGARWSYSPGDTNFRCRVLLFRNGVVIEKHSEYYFD